MRPAARLGGIIVPIVTPFKVDETLDLEALRSHIRYVMEGGVHGIFALGTTGEFALLSPSERREVLEATMDEVKGRLPVIGGVSDPGTRNVLSLAEVAADTGVDVLAVTAPYYYAVGEEGIYAHFEAVCERLDTPVMIYNIPSATGHEITLPLAQRLAQLDNVVAMKYTTDDLHKFTLLTQALAGRLSMLIGSDALIYPALCIGADGAVAGSANVLPRRIVEIYRLYTQGDITGSRRAQKEALPLIEGVLKGTYPAGVKEALRLLGRDVGPVRRPLTSLTEVERESLGGVLQKLAGV